MSDIYTVPYSTFSKRLDDWLREAGGEVEDLTLDLYNRALDFLLLEADWEELLVRYQLSSLSSNSQALPADCSRIVRCWHDSNGDGKPDWYYYEHANVETGYYLSSSFDINTGRSKTITFYRSPNYDPYIEYIKTLTHFTGEGTEYSFFPHDLLTRTAQLIHIGEADLVGKEYEAILFQQDKMMRNYKTTHQYKNRDMASQINDNAGYPIEVEDYNLTADIDRNIGPYDNDYDYGL